ncbi:MAG: DUF1015 domain-containing protein [Planctomycetota bacterium]
MARIAPLRALTYNREKVYSLSTVTAPPYDVIDADERRALMERHPHNIIRLVLDKPRGGGREDGEYEQAASLLRRWRRDGVLVQDDEPSIYICRQTFSVGETTISRTGFLAGLRLEELGEGQIFPHEKTMPAPREDRLELMKACRANLSPVFTIYSDPEGDCAEFVREVESREPLHEFERGDGQRCALWRVQDAEWQEHLRSLLGPQTVCIADGHHRYETALHYRDQARPESAPAGDAPEDYVLALFVSVADPGLTVLPTHRVLRADGMDHEAMLDHLRSRFTVLSDPDGGTLDERWEALREQGASIGYYGPDGALYGIALPDEGADADDPSLESLPVSVLNESILRPFFGGSGDELACELDYHHRAADVEDDVQRGDYQAGFLLPPLPPRVVERIARSGGRLPPKSTYFYPKIPSGLLIYPFD